MWILSPSLLSVDDRRHSTTPVALPPRILVLGRTAVPAIRVLPPGRGERIARATVTAALPGTRHGRDAADNSAGRNGCAARLLGASSGNLGR
jgi:hypothetical protein